MGQRVVLRPAHLWARGKRPPPRAPAAGEGLPRGGAGGGGVRGRWLRQEFPVLWHGPSGRLPRRPTAPSPRSRHLRADGAGTGAAGPGLRVPGGRPALPPPRGEEDPRLRVLGGKRRAGGAVGRGGHTHQWTRLLPPDGSTGARAGPTARGRTGTTSPREQEGRAGAAHVPSVSPRVPRGGYR